MSLTELPLGRLVLIRHGQASLGTDDYDRLSPRGWAQSAYLGERLRDIRLVEATIHRGSLRRHRETTEALKLPHPVQLDDGLNEYAVDHLIGAAVEQAPALGIAVPEADAFADPHNYLATFLEWFPTVLSHWQTGALVCPHNGTWTNFHHRVTESANAWVKAISAGQTVVAVTSAGVISTIVAQLLGKSLGWQRECNVTLYNASVTELHLTEDAGWHLVTLNCVSHLSDTADHTLA